MKGFICLPALLLLTLFSCSNAKDDNASVAVGIGQRALLGKVEATNAEMNALRDVCQALEAKEANFAADHEGKIFSYNSVITENGCSSGAVNLTHSLSLELKHSNGSGYEFINQTVWVDPKDKAHFSFEFETNADGQGNINFNKICEHVLSLNEDRVIQITPNKRSTYYVKKTSSITTRVDVYSASGGSDNWINSKLHSVTVLTDPSAFYGLVQESEITNSCSPSERKLVTYKATFTGTN